MDAAYCTEHVSKTLGIMGTPVIYTEYEIAFFYVKSYIERVSSEDVDLVEEQNTS